MITIEKIIEYYHSKKYTLILGNKIHWKNFISIPKSIQEANKNHFSFISKKFSLVFDTLINSTNCKIILVDESLINKKNTPLLPKEITFILSKNPKKDLIDFAHQFFPINFIPKETFIHPTAQISKNTSIGTQTIIEAGVIIEENVKIGNKCRIGASSIIKRHTTINNKVIIGSCNVIGGDGFGYIKNNNTGKYDHFPHYGGVIIEDEVHIGNNTCIDRGSLKDTLIKTGVKIDNLVHIAHNVEIGEHSLIIACSMIAGSVKVGKNSWVAPSSNIRNAINIGDNTTIGIGSTVTKNIKGNQTVLGSPAVPLEEFMIQRKNNSKKK